MKIVPPQPFHPTVVSQIGVADTVVMVALLLGAMLVLVIMLRKFLRSGAAQSESDPSNSKPHMENPTAFMTASMQGVIEKLRAQEKELARLHVLAQERAQESERMTEEVTRNMPTGLLLVSATGAISSTNPAAEAALGLRPMRYRSYKEIFGDDSGLAQMLTACLRDGKTFQRGEVEHLTSSGDVRRLGVTISPIYRAARMAVRTYATDAPAGPEMRVSGALCLMSDLTELTALQKQIRWKENLAALGEMSAGIAHEFKNALATISGYAQMIRNEAKPGDIRDSSEKILDQTRALTHVVTEFLRFAKPLEICYETVSMQPLVERVALEIQEAIPQCQVACEGEFIDLPGDDALLRQALLNLTRNGAEASRDSGESPRVTISGTMEELGGRKWQRICVADNGPGIPEHDLPKIFLPFYTTKSEGTGLGLAVVQKIALQHGGSIEARTRPGGGAEFLLWLPLRQDLRRLYSLPRQPASKLVQGGCPGCAPGGVAMRRLPWMLAAMLVVPAGSWGQQQAQSQPQTSGSSTASSASNASTTATPAPQQDSLADAARKAREQKKDAPKTSKVFTNDNIPAQGGISTVGKAAAPPTDSATNAPSSGTDEKMWRDKFATLRQKLATDQADLDVMQREIGVLDIQNYSDPVKAMQQALTRSDINKKAADIDAKTKEIEADKQAIADAEGDLRKAGGDSGWAR